MAINNLAFVDEIGLSGRSANYFANGTLQETAAMGHKIPIANLQRANYIYSASQLKSTKVN